MTYADSESILVPGNNGWQNPRVLYRKISETYLWVLKHT